MKSKHLSIITSCLAIAAAAPVASAANILLIADDFSGGTGDLTTIVADTFAAGITSVGGNSAWVAATSFNADGSISSTGETSAYLNLGTYINDAKGTSTGKFILSATITDPTVGAVSLGFFQTGLINRAFSNAGTGSTATAYHRGTDGTGTNYFGGTGTNNAFDAGDLNGTVTFTTTVDFTTAGGYNGTTNFGKVTFANSANANTSTFTYTTNPLMNYVGFSTTSSGSTTAAVDNLKLEQIPEPNVAALFGGLGMLALLRRRRCNG